MANATQSKRGPYARSARTRQQAIDAAIDIFSTDGYQGATLTDVAEQLGITLTGLHYHFPDKDSLLMAVLEDRDRSRLSSESTDDLDILLEIVDYNISHPASTRLFCIISAEATNPAHPAHDYFVRRYGQQRAAGETYFRRLIDHGKLSASASPLSLATQLIAMSDGLQQQWLLEPGSVDVRAEMRRFLHAAIPALSSVEE